MNKVLVLLGILLPVFSSAQTSSSTPYFQQTVDHIINVKLDDVNHELEADIVTTYKNNSPETLEFLWIHVWPNAYSNANTALAKQQFRNNDMFMFYALARDIGGIDNLDFKVNGEKADWTFHEEYIDIVKVNLKTPLKPGETLQLSTPFKVRIPSGKISRLGHIGESYQITQWYPKPAVYDRDGWHEMPYLDQGEFYSEYGTFDVHITLPENYIVGATGDFVLGSDDNDAEIVRLDELNVSTRAYLDTATFTSDNSFPPSSGEFKTLHYHQEKVHDFGWFADKRYKLVKDTLTLPHSGREITTWVMFTPAEEELWSKASEYIHDATYYYSLWNGDYPYNQVTAVDGTISAGGGMEYPNVTVIGSSGSAFGLDQVIAHEVGHNWFYGILGSNERSNAWMDEGINSYNETRYILERYDGNPNLAMISSRLTDKLMQRFDLGDFQYRWINELAYILPARFGNDQPIQCHSTEFTSTNYGAIVYMKTAAVFGFLRDYLGTEKFDKAMQYYFNTWKFKHPQPSDLQASLETSTGENLSWFFDEWIKTTKKNDWSISRAKSSDYGVSVKVRNVGDIISPVKVVALKGDSVIASKWIKPSTPKTVVEVEFPGINADKITIDPYRFDLEYDRKNNTSRTTGLFKRVEPVKVKMVTRLEDGNTTQLFWAPALAWNAHNGLMLGATFHNTTLPLRNFEWMATPLISRSNVSGNLGLNGLARISYSSGPLHVSLRGQRFSSFELHGEIPLITVSDSTEPAQMNRLSLGILRKFNKTPQSPLSSALRFESVYLEGFLDSDMMENSGAKRPIKFSNSLKFDAAKRMKLIHQNIGIEIRHFSIDQISNPLLFPPDIYSYQDVQTTAYYNISRQTGSDGRQITLSLNGSVLSDKLSNPGSKLQIATAGYGAQYDPLADNLLLNRGATTGILSAQTSLENGLLPLYHLANEWMASARLDVDVTDKLNIFTGILAFDDISVKSNIDAVAGIEMKVGPLKIQMPLISKAILDNVGGYKPFNYWMFSFNIRDLEPWGLIRKTL